VVLRAVIGQDGIQATGDVVLLVEHRDEDGNPKRGNPFSDSP